MKHDPVETIAVAILIASVVIMLCIIVADIIETVTLAYYY
jgi:hypothetical protein